ncbi:hypothetical protein ACEQ8H_003339, partial [Pleosporales sp. CAS-2024a]
MSAAPSPNSFAELPTYFLALMIQLVSQPRDDDETSVQIWVASLAAKMTDMRVNLDCDRHLANLNRTVVPHKYRLNNANYEELVYWTIADRDRPTVQDGATLDRPAHSAGRMSDLSEHQKELRLDVVKAYQQLALDLMGCL